MTTEAGEDQIAALQQEVRSSGDAVRWIRIAFLLFAALFLAVSRWGGASPQALLVYLVLMGGFVMVAIGFAAAVRCLERSKLRHLLQALQPFQQAQMLLPLRATAGGDTQKITHSLLRELRVPTELTPADAPPAAATSPRPPPERTAASPRPRGIPAAVGERPHQGAKRR
jgi:hypothetical protein